MSVCGGFNTPSTTITPWYYRNGPVQTASYHDTATFQVFLGDANAVHLGDFRNLTKAIAITVQGENKRKGALNNDTDSTLPLLVLPLEASFASTLTHEVLTIGLGRLQY